MKKIIIVLWSIILAASFSTNSLAQMQPNGSQLIVPRYAFERAFRLPRVCYLNATTPPDLLNITWTGGTGAEVYDTCMKSIKVWNGANWDSVALSGAYGASNGISLVGGNTFKLGGNDLIENTEIHGNELYGFRFHKLTDFKINIPSAGVGKVLTSDVDGFATWQTPASGGITQLTGDAVAGPGSGSQPITISPNMITDAKLRQSVGLSVVGRSANSTGNVADISAATDHDVLRRSGTSILFGKLDVLGINATGSPGPTTVLHGNGTWAVPAGGGGGVTAVGAFQNFGTANAASISGNNINMHKVSATNPGLLSTGTDTIAGIKRFNNRVILPQEGFQLQLHDSALNNTRFSGIGFKISPFSGARHMQFFITGKVGSLNPGFRWRYGNFDDNYWHPGQTPAGDLMSLSESGLTVSAGINPFRVTNFGARQITLIDSANLGTRLSGIGSSTGAGYGTNIQFNINKVNTFVPLFRFREGDFLPGYVEFSGAPAAGDIMYLSSSGMRLFVPFNPTSLGAFKVNNFGSRQITLIDSANLGTKLSGIGSSNGATYGTNMQFNINRVTISTPFFRFREGDFDNGYVEFNTGTPPVGDMMHLSAQGMRLLVPIVNPMRIGAIGSPHASAILDLPSTTRGFLPPRQTNAQQNAISTPAAGLQLYNTTLSQPHYRDGSTWQAMVGMTFGIVAPASTPTAIGNFYLDTVSKKLYVSTGTASSADWNILN